MSAGPVPPAEPARILYYYASQQFNTGSPKALAAQIDLLDRARYAPLFFATGEGPLVDVLAERGVAIVRGPSLNASWRRPLASWRAVQRQRAMLREQRVALLHVNELGWNLDLVLAAWREGIPVVLQLHLPYTIGFQNLHRFAARRILLVSEAQRLAIEHFGRIAPRCQVLYSPVNVAAYGAGRPIRAELGLGASDVVVCVVAQLREGKGIDVVLDAARRLAPDFPALRFLLVGPLGRGEEAFGERMQAAAKEPPLAGVVRFTGSRTDIPDVLASSDLFVLPTQAETFGLAVVEAMAAGRPVVTTRLPVMEEIVTSDQLGVLVAPRTGEAFARAIRTVLELPDRGRAMGERGRRSVADRFDPSVIARQLNALYAELLA